MSTESRPFEIAYPEEPGRAVRGVVERPEGSADEDLPWVLLLHGFKGFMDWGFFPLLSRGLAESGMVAVRFNTSGSGVGPDLRDFSDLAAFERDTFTRQLEDYDRVRGLVVTGELGRVDPSRGGLLGHSRGGGLGLVHASEHSYQAIVTWAALAEVVRFDEPTVAQWRAQGHLDVPNARTGQTMRMGLAILEDYERDPQRFDVARACAQVRCPTLVVHGTADESVPFEHAERIHAALPDSHLLGMEDAGHTFGAMHPLTGITPILARVLSRTLEHLASNLG